MPHGVVWLAATIQHVAETVLGLCDDSRVGCVGAVGQDRSPPALGCREVAAEEHEVAATDATRKNGRRISRGGSDPTRLDVCRVGAIEVCLEAANATHPHPRADPIGYFEPLVA